MANLMLVRQRIRDYDEWRPGFDAAIPQRAAAWLSGTRVMRGSDDPNQITILFEAADLERARSYAESPDLREATQRAGVIGQPEIQFLREDSA